MIYLVIHQRTEIILSNRYRNQKDQRSHLNLLSCEEVLGDFGSVAASIVLHE